MNTDLPGGSGADAAGGAAAGTDAAGGGVVGHAPHVARPGLPAGRPGRAARSTLDVAVAAAVIVMLAFPLAALVATPRGLAQLNGPAAPLDAGAAVDGPRPALRDVPALVPGSLSSQLVATGGINDPSRLRAALAPAAAAALGLQGDGLLALIAQSRTFDTQVIGRPDDLAGQPTPYPWRYAPLEPFLQQALPEPPDAAKLTDLATVLIYYAVYGGQDTPAANASTTAFALLDRARPTGGCPTALDIEFLVAADASVQVDPVVTAEAARASAACPGDPTPAHLLAQFQTGRVKGGLPGGLPDIFGDPNVDARRNAAAATVVDEERRLPASPVGWADHGDLELRLGYLTEDRQPFTTRNHAQRAEAAYRAALVRAPGDPGLLEGLAQAQSLAGDSAGAAATAGRALSDRSPTLQRERRLGYLESAHQFPAAASLADGVLRSPVLLVRGPALAPVVPSTAALAGYDFNAPLSLGAELVKPVVLAVGPQTGGFGGGILDLSFVPPYHPIEGITGENTDCLDWSHRRDALLAGDPGPAGQPPTDSVGPVSKCTTDETLLRAVAVDRSGDTGGALAAIRGYPELPKEIQPSAFLSYTDENLSRYAGNLPQAAAAIVAWAGDEPQSALASGEGAEVQFLGRDYPSAAASFARAAARAGSPLEGARYRLGEGTSLELAHRYDPALTALAAVDQAASALLPADLSSLSADSDKSDPVIAAQEQAVYVAYNARLQAADTELRRHNVTAALPRYAAAARLAPVLDRLQQGSTKPLTRPEVLENNEALALVSVGRPADALPLMDAALAKDGANPVFLQNRGWVSRRLGRRHEATVAYEAALAADPTFAPAANDLGVLRTEAGDVTGARRAFRQALAAQPGYATAAFNLGVLETRQGVARLLSAQGALAKATRADAKYGEQALQYVYDDTTEFTTLDLSKPVPPQWAFGRAADREPAGAVALVVIGLIVLRLGRALTIGHLGDEAGGRLLESVTGRRRRGRLGVTSRSVHPAVALLACAAVVAIPLLRAGGAPRSHVAIIAASALVLAVAYQRVRGRYADRARRPVYHHGWLATLGVAAIGAAAGFVYAPAAVAYAPLPVAEPDGELRTKFHAIGPALLVAVAVALLVFSHTTRVPLTRQMAEAALVLASSAFTSVKPCDGAYLEGWRGTIPPITLLVLAGLLAVHLI